MDKPKIFVTHRLPGGYLEKLEKSFEVEVFKGKELSRNDLLEGVANTAAIICTLKDQIDSEVMQAAGPDLKIICNYAAIDKNIDIAEATKRNIYVTNVHGALTEAMAEGVIALTICLLRRIVEGDRFVRTGNYKGWEFDLLVGTSLSNKVLGIIGLGKVGRWTARLAIALGMKVVYTGKHRNEEYENLYGVSFRNLEKLLKESDVVSLSCPLTEETRHMIGEKEFKLMKPTAVIINVASGQLVDEPMLIKALSEGWIAGAGLDVYEDDTEVPAGLKNLSNTVLTPQIASASIEARLVMAKLAVENILDIMEGNRPECLVNPEIWRGRID